VVLLLLVGVAVVALTIFGGSGTPTSVGSTPTTQTEVTAIQTTKLTTTTTKFTPPPDELIPPRATAEATAKRQKLGDGRVVPEWITYSIGGEKVRFRLIAAGGTVQPFYISETKISNSMYRAGGGGPKEALGGDKAPVVGITAEEAWAFAVQQFQGRLPTSEEWDHAVGLPSSAPGATTISLPGTDAWVNKSVPGAVNRPQADVNGNDLIDMAGNGREWTCTILVERDKPSRNVDNGKFEKKELVIVRGRSYTLTRPLTYSMLTFEQKEPQTEFAGMGSP
jgi:formylglycine-generating enzyme required for sulfatase activity